MKHFFKIATAVLAILLAFALYKLDEKEFQLQSAIFNQQCQFDTELADAFQELMATQMAVDERGDTSLMVDERYFEENNIPVKYYKIIRRSVKQLGKDYKKMEKAMVKEYGEGKMLSIQEMIENQRQAYLESKNQE